MTSIGDVRVMSVTARSSIAVILALGWRDGNAGLGCSKKGIAAYFRCSIWI